MKIYVKDLRPVFKLQNNKLYCTSYTVLQSYSVTVLQSYSVTVLQSYNIKVQCCIVTVHYLTFTNIHCLMLCVPFMSIQSNINKKAFQHILKCKSRNLYKNTLSTYTDTYRIPIQIVIVLCWPLIPYKKLKSIFICKTNILSKYFSNHNQ
jgi:hypothetical protein